MTGVPDCLSMFSTYEVELAMIRVHTISFLLHETYHLRGTGICTGYSRSGANEFQI